MIRVLTGDCRALLATLPAASVQCCVTSPPYYGLRDYGVAGQIGLEASPDEYVAALVGVMREVRRVLRDDGTLWLNLGDSYAGSWGNQGRKPERGSQRPINGPMLQIINDERYPSIGSNTGKCPPGTKPKDLLMMPARVALALQADGWWLRSDIIWAKPNPMPESVTDRPTSAHEHVFLLAKQPRYFFDADAVREIEAVPDWDNGTRVFGGVNKHGANIQHGERTTGRLATTRVKIPGGWDRGEGAHGTIHREGRTSAEYQEAVVKPGRNIRNVWTIATAPYPEAHFATFPPELAERCIKAGSKPGDTILDPFAGAGTTLLVADQLQRHAVGIELNPAYSAMASNRVRDDAPLLAEVAD